MSVKKNSTKSKWRYIWALPIAMLIISSIPKIFSMEFMEQNMEAAGLNITLPLLGIIELICVIIFLIPRTRNVGFLLTASYIGGIIAVEWISPTADPYTGIVLQTLLWVGMYFENPTLFQFAHVKT